MSVDPGIELARIRVRGDVRVGVRVRVKGRLCSESAAWGRGEGLGVPGAEVVSSCQGREETQGQRWDRMRARVGARVRARVRDRVGT